MPDNPLKIVICMGSSCFSRGNNRNIEVLQDIVSSAGTTGCNLVGHLCQDHCKDGPNITINGSAYRDVDPVTLLSLVNHHRSQKGSCDT